MWKVVKQVPRPLILIGVGNIGTSLCSNFADFEGKGLKIVAAFDNDPRNCGNELGHIKVVEHVSAIQRVAKESGVKIAILAIPGDKAQEITKICVDAGISTILNYSPVSLNVPQHVHVEYMDPALKIQMALRSNTHCTNKGTASPHLGLHYSPFPAHIIQPVTPLITPLCKYSYCNKVITRGYSTTTHTSLHSKRYSSDFEEIGTLGKGGFGSVHQARNHIDGMSYAVKKIRINANLDVNNITNHKYLREVRAMARLNHPNLVRYYYAWVELEQKIAEDGEFSFPPSNSVENSSVYSDPIETTDESCSSEPLSQTTSVQKEGCQRNSNAILYIQMELCMGVTLRDWLARPGRTVRLQECYSILLQLLQGLQHIHANGFIHRDVTPPNIFLETKDDQLVIKIGDFGLTKHCNDYNEGEVFGRIPVDKTVGVGTFLYASPEQFSNSAYDTKADIYSVGIILFELLSPFNTQMERICLLTQLREGNMPLQISLKYPSESAIIELLLNKNPAKRPSAEELTRLVKQ